MRILFLLLLLVSVASAQTSQTQYVDWATGCGGNDGTIGNPYCTCTEWEAQNRDLVTEDVTLTVQFTGNPTGNHGCTFSGWTTDATRRIVVDGMTFTTTTYGGTFTVGVSNITIRNSVVVRNGASTSSHMMIINAGTTGVIIERNIFGLGASWTRDGGQYGLRILGSGTIRNNILYGFPDRPLDIQLSAGRTIDVYNNTVISAGTVGIDSQIDTTPTGTVINLYNNIVQNASSTDYILVPGVATLNTSNNLSKDATSPQAGLRNITLTFVDAAARNYRLAAGDTGAIDAGSTVGSFSDDIDGTTRPSGSAWDIGAHEYIQAPTSKPFSVLQAIGAL